MNRVFQGTPGKYDPTTKVYNGPARFPERFDDEADYFSLREEVSPRRVRTNFVPQMVEEQLPAADPGWGEGVAVKFFEMGGQLTLNVALVGMAPRGLVRVHAPLAEESLFVLAGRGRTDLWARDGERFSVEWEAGDLICPPLGVPRQHFAAEEEVRILKVRNVIIERALGMPVEEPALESPIPDRFNKLFPPETNH
jgi:quercetin dioxygenase-like cupin family protein